MDVSDILAVHAGKYRPVTVEKDTPLDVDPGLLLVTDLNPIEEEVYNENREEHLLSLARDGVQSLMAALFSLPTKPSPDGPVAILPPAVYQLPRAKPLPKPKPPTKWERFAAAKGIQKQTREKKTWDEAKQEWVNKWGKGGKNREKEEQWLHEVPANADVNYDPRKLVRDQRKERITKNEKRHQQNLNRALGSNPLSASSDPRQRRGEIQRTLATTRVSTASMGKFDRQLEGEKKLRGVKRKFDPAEASAEEEKKVSLNLIAKMESESKKIKKTPTEESVLNVRKAIRFASKGKGGVALAREIGTQSKSVKSGGKGKAKGKGR